MDQWGWADDRMICLALWPMCPLRPSLRRQPPKAPAAADESPMMSLRPRGSAALALVAPLLQVALLWLLSDLGFYLVLPAIGVAPDYNTNGVAIALYYAFWSGVAVIGFWPLYAIWSRYAQWKTFENRLLSLAVWSVAFAGAMYFVARVLPALPAFDLREGVIPPALPLANGWYFLPKSVEILFQQLLVTALVLGLAARDIGLRRISLACALVFGAAHLLLAFGDAPWGYVLRFTAMASLFGLAFPYLLLRVPMGLAYSYVAHWGFYALLLTLVRSFGAPSAG